MLVRKITNKKYVFITLYPFIDHIKNYAPTDLTTRKNLKLKKGKWVCTLVSKWRNISGTAISNSTRNAIRSKNNAKYSLYYTSKRFPEIKSLVISAVMVM